MSTSASEETDLDVDYYGDLWIFVRDNFSPMPKIMLHLLRVLLVVKSYGMFMTGRDLVSLKKLRNYRNNTRSG